MKKQMIRSIRVAGWSAFLGLALSACSQQGQDGASASQSPPNSPSPQATSPLPQAQAVVKAIKAAASGGQLQQYTCVIDEVNMRLDLGHRHTEVMALPAIGATPIGKNVLLLDAGSAEDAAQRIMQAKEEYKRIPPQCEPFALSIRGAALDTSTPLDQYVPLKSGEQMAHLFYAVSKEPPPYEHLAKLFYPEYQAEFDNFKRQDMMKTIRAETDAKIQAADKQRLILLTGNTYLGHYDPATHSFALGYAIGPDRYTWIGNNTRDYHLSLDAPGTPKLRVMPESEEEARKLEALVTNRQPKTMTTQFGAPMVYRLYAQIVKAAMQGNEKGMMARVVQVDIVDWGCLTCDRAGRTGEVIARMNLR